MRSLDISRQIQPVNVSIRSQPVIYSTANRTVNIDEQNKDSEETTFI